MPLGTDVNRGPGDVLLDGVATPPKRGTAASFRSMSIVAKPMDGRMNTPLGTEVDLGLGHIVLDGDPAPPSLRKGHSSPLFSAHVYCGHCRPSQLLLSSCYKIFCSRKFLGKTCLAWTLDTAGQFMKCPGESWTVGMPGLH